MPGSTTATASDGDSDPRKNWLSSGSMPTADDARRDNWFGEGDTETATAEHSDHGPPDKDARLAHLLLRECAPKLCGRGVAELAADEQEERLLLDVAPAFLTLTEPELHIPKSGSDTFGTHDYGQYRHRRRYNPKSGYISSGESTWVEFGLVDHETLMQCVDAAIELFDTLPRLDRKARERANELKRNPNGPPDKKIMAEVICVLRNDSGGK